MKNIFLSLDSGSIEQQKKKKATVFAILITAALLALTLVVFLITGVISLVTDGSDKGSDGKNSTDGYVTVTLTEEQKSNGNLLFIDDNHPYRGNASTMLMAGAANRPKTNGGSWIYTIGGTQNLGGTEEAISAFNEMLADFYADESSRGDDNIYVNLAHHNTSTTQNDIYKSGLCFALTYYENYNADPSKRPSIYGVDKYVWIYQNAHKYGFIQLYPVTTADSDTANANVFRYVGEAHATYIKAQNITLEQYLEFLKSKTAEAPLSITCGSSEYLVYYTESTEVLAPKDIPYTVSGNNMGGYVITVKLS